MKLHTVFITYNRLELTKRAVESFLETVIVPFSLVIVDNCSTDGTTKWIMDNAFGDYILLSKNRYPGFACNRGWALSPGNADLLQRADNDNEFLPGWCDEVERCFEGRPYLGQLGLRTNAQDGFCKRNVSGDCIIRRELWDKGLRWEEKPWSEYPKGTAESLPMAKAVTKLRYEWDRVKRPCIQPIAPEDPNDPYYIESWRSRGILDWALARHQ